MPQRLGKGSALYGAKWAADGESEGCVGGCWPLAPGVWPDFWLHGFPEKLHHGGTEDTELIFKSAFSVISAPVHNSLSTYQQPERRLRSPTCVIPREESTAGARRTEGPAVVLCGRSLLTLFASEEAVSRQSSAVSRQLRPSSTVWVRTRLLVARTLCLCLDA